MVAVVGSFTGFSILCAVIPNICIIFLPEVFFFLIAKIGRFSGIFLCWKRFIAIGLEWLLVSEAVCFSLSEIPVSVKAPSPRIPTA